MMSDAGLLALHPGLHLILGAAVVAVLRGPARTAVALALALLALVTLWQFTPATLTVVWLDHTLMPLRADALARLFATIFLCMALVGALFSAGQPSRVELPAALVYAGSAVGVALAGDLLTLFVFWEVMAIGSTLVIWSAATPAASAASRRYLMVHLAGGVLLLCGVAGQLIDTGRLQFDVMTPDHAARWLILAAFLINAGAPPFSAWLPDAYPEATWSGTVFLSAFTTKAAVYALLRGFPGTELLIPVGVFMIFYGIVYALLENDMRRILAYSIVNQVGFMIVGVGIGTPLALNGAAAHAFTHILYKALLLMSAGSVLYMTGRRKCSELGGLFQSMPLTTLCGIVGALAISSFPLTSGFVSKSMVTQSAADQHLFYLWLALAAASAGVFLHAGIKFPWFVFFQKDSGLRPPDPPWSMRLAMLLLVLPCIGLGMFPGPLYSLLPYAAPYEPYTGAHVVAQLQLLLFSGLAFFAMLGWLKRTPTLTLDLDWFARVALPALGRRMGATLAMASAPIWSLLQTTWRSAITQARIWCEDGGPLARTWSTGAMGLWMLVLLLIVLLDYYL